MDALPDTDSPLTPEAERLLSGALHETHPDIDDAMWHILTERATDPSTPPIGTELIDGPSGLLDPPWDAPAARIDEPQDLDLIDPWTDQADDWDIRPHGFDGSPNATLGHDTDEFRAQGYQDDADPPDFNDPGTP